MNPPKKHLTIIICPKAAATHNHPIIPHIYVCSIHIHIYNKDGPYKHHFSLSLHTFHFRKMSLARTNTNTHTIYTYWTFSLTTNEYALGYYIFHKFTDYIGIQAFLPYFIYSEPVCEYSRMKKRRFYKYPILFRFKVDSSIM